MLAKDQSLQEKGNKLSEYVLVGPSLVVLFLADNQDHVKPVMDEVYNYVLGAKVGLVRQPFCFANCQKKAQEEADKASNHVNGQ